jgi:putative transposase
MIKPEWQNRLYHYIGGILHANKSILLCAGGMPDHVHLLIGQHPTKAMSDLIREVKAHSSRWVHDVLREQEFEWQRGYGAFSVSYSLLEPVKHYISHQEEHHNKMSFRDEYVQLIVKNGLEYDDRYVWD